MNGANGNGSTIASFSLIERVVNINRSEFPRVAICWLILFFGRLGFVIGWTALIAMFVSRFGIFFLPTFLIADAILMIGGTIIYSKFIDKTKRELLMVITILAASILLFSSTFFSGKNDLLFFALSLSAEAIFVMQLFIIISLFREDMFSPLESERTFPFIESAETIGGILGGLAVVLLTTIMPVYKLMFIWIILLLLVVFVIVFFNMLIHKLPQLPFFEEKIEEKTENLTERWKKAIKNIKQIPFLKGLLIIIFTQWIFLHMLDFQYIKAVEQYITSKQEETLVYQQNPRIFQISLLTDPQGVPSSPEGLAGIIKKAAAGAKNHEEEELTRVLGSFHVIFSIFALLTQLFIASRLIHRLGIVKSLLINPILVSLAFIAFLLKYSFVTAAITKASFEFSFVVHKNAYHSSYYALKSQLRDQAKEFLEGLTKPAGVIASMGLLMVFQLFLSGKSLTLAINLIMATVLIFMLINTIRLKKKYTNLSKEMLFLSQDEFDKLTAIEILGQKGHHKAFEILLRALRLFDKEEYLKIKILKAIGALHDKRSLPFIIDAFSDQRKKVRLTAVQTLESFYDLPSEAFYNQAFSQYRVDSALKELFLNESSGSIRLAIIKVFALFKEKEIVSFLLKTMQESSPEIQAQCIHVCGLFRDPNAAFYIEPYLDSENPKIKANTIIALHQFPWLKTKVNTALNEMVDSNNKETLMEAFHAISHTKWKKGKHILLKALEGSEDKDIQFEAAMALSNLNVPKGINQCVSMLTDAEEIQLEHFQKAFKYFDPKSKKFVKKCMAQIFSRKIQELINQLNGDSEMNIAVLKKLRNLYDLLDYHKESYKLQKIIEKKIPLES